MSRISKEAITVRRDGLLGLGNAGWEDYPSENQIAEAISKVFHKYGHICEKWEIVDDGYRDSDEFPISVNVKYASIPLPWTTKSDSWSYIKENLSKQSGLNMAGEVDDLLEGTLRPIIMYEDFGPIDGEKQIVIAHSLAIPARTFILKRVR